MAYIKKKDLLFSEYRKMYYNEYSNIEDLASLKKNLQQQIQEINLAKKTDPLLARNYLCKEERLEVLRAYKEALESCENKIKVIEYIDYARTQA